MEPFKFWLNIKQIPLLSFFKTDSKSENLDLVKKEANWFNMAGLLM